MKFEAVERRAFLSTLGLGAAAVLEVMGTADAAQWTDAEEANVKSSLTSAQRYRRATSRMSSLSSPTTVSIA
jgi:hypothetical protein